MRRARYRRLWSIERAGIWTTIVPDGVKDLCTTKYGASLMSMSIPTSEARSTDRASQKNVKLAVSNPCFELWLLLHFRDQTAHISRQDAKRVANQLGIMEGKEIRSEMFDQLENQYEDAKRRARALDRKHEGDGSPPGSNPSTCMWRLIDSIRRPPAGRESES